MEDEIENNTANIVLAMVSNSQVGCRSGSELEPNHCNGSYHTKTLTIAIGLVYHQEPCISTSQVCL